MNIIELLIVALALSLDAFSAAICKGLSMKMITIKKATIVGLYFGIFQAGMPIIGYYLGLQFQDKIIFIDHWLAFILLTYIGSSMIVESRKNIISKSLTEYRDKIGFINMITVALATSIDALAVGVTFAFLKVDLLLAVTLIGIITFLVSAIGVKVGHIFGITLKSSSEILGGVVLIIIGINILFEHIGLIHF